ncbi:peptidase S1 and S6 chymotrypsin/Hap [Cellulomonas flavigena DSM 20109]|uniref:Peptidase S1 and S6 chymotrypsin/Hap n=1 Tax=Cellulomonas flavigena (strain ATCC 482 / DSM 20109 / BCRC 11376 / JCM 18109 / NBRC 3775 / NCIMB 8073 / NRS 134) TaxID=446466 RepID=D5UBR3_CELFN|nr:S1 family peptidase [Cellulomonas flavigena]ADG74158.1 peptidase S1 and S6 chymotrypsin/Hap [Cellulomonas flavigena DSM 20109]
MSESIGRSGHGQRVGLVALAALVALTAVEAPARAVQGSVTEPAAAAATVRLEIAGDPSAAPGQTRERACSGALVAASWVMTAASCFADASGVVPAGAPVWATTATVGRPDLTATSGQVVKIDRLVSHPDRDVVLAHLATGVSGTAPVPVATTAPVVGETLTVSGYGRTKDAVVPRAVHAAPYTVASVLDVAFDITPAQDDAGICKGDAGGPALRTTGSGGVELVAIHHTAYQGGCLGSASTRRDATETRVDDLRPWVLQVTAPKPGDDGFQSAYVASLYRDLYTVNGGRVWEAASNNGWRNQDSQVPAPGAIAAMTARGVKYIYTVNGGQVWEAASNDGWTNRSSLVTTAGPLAVAVLD